MSAAPPGPRRSALGGSEALDLHTLRAAAPKRVVEAHEALLALPAFRGTRGGAMPVTDATTLPADPRTVPAAAPHVPVIIGTAADEATFLFCAAGRRLELGSERLRAMIAHLPDVGGPDAAQAAIDAERARGPADDESVLCRLATRRLFAGPVQEWAAARARAGGDVFRYRIAHRAPDARLGATHTIDVPLVFGTHEHEIGARVAGSGPSAQAVSEAMMGAWREFVHGRPPWDQTQERTF